MFDFISILKNKILDFFYLTFKDQMNIEEFSREGIEKEFSVEIPKKREFGDLTSNISLIFASKLKLPPKKIAEDLIKNLNSCESEKFFQNEFSEINIAGNGFINFKFHDKSLIKILKNILDDEKYGGSEIGLGKKINIEFCSANPTGPVHLGHIRGAVWGMVISNILKFSGFDVHKEFYINDGGGQIECLVKTALIRYLELFNFSFSEKTFENLYPGEYLIQIAKNLKEEFNDEFLISFLNYLNHQECFNNNFVGKISKELSEEGISLKINSFLCEKKEIFQKIRRFTLDQILKIIKEDLKFFNVEFDIFSSETEILSQNNSEFLNETLEIFKNQDLLYYGTLEKPKGQDDLDDDWEEKEQLLFKSTKFGDDLDRAMKRSSTGEWTYFAKDCAYHLHKLKRNYDRLILEVGVDHIGYKKRLTAAISALSIGLFSKKTQFDFEFHNLVYIKKNNQQLKMSKRSGNIIGAEFLRENLGSDVTKFFLLSKKHDMELDLDIDKAMEVSKDNPYFYIQYANTRANSILRNFEKDYKDYFEEFNKLNLIDLYNIFENETDDCRKSFKITQHEKEILLHIISFPKIIIQIAQNLEPHRINFYLSELAHLIHSWWNDGISNQESRIILIDQKDHSDELSKIKTFFRIYIIKAVLKIIETGLKLINIEPLKVM